MIAWYIRKCNSPFYRFMKEKNQRFEIGLRLTCSRFWTFPVTLPGNGAIQDPRLSVLVYLGYAIAQDSYAEAVTPHVTVLEMVFKEVTKVKQVRKGRALIQQEWCPGTKRKRHQISFSSMRGHSKKGATYKSGRELLPEPNHAGTLILDSQPPELQESKFMFLKPPNLQYFVMAAQPNTWCQSKVCNFMMIHMP